MKAQNFSGGVFTGILILGITAGILVITELWLGLTFPEKIPHDLHPAYGYKLKPNYEATVKRAEINGGDVITWRTNSLGFRGNELRENADTRIIVYGDSNIHAIFSKQENTFTSKLESYLSELLDADIEVINAGVMGYGPDQSLIKMSLDADVYKPDIIIFHVFADNDFGDLIRNRFFEIVDGNLVRRKDSIASHVTSVTQQLRDFVSSLHITRAALKLTGVDGARDLTRKKRSEEYTEEYIRSLLTITENDYSAYKLGGSYFTTDHYDIDIALSPGSDSSTLKVALMEGVLLEVQRIVNSKGIQLLVLIQPSTIDLTKNMESFNHEDLLSKSSSYKRERLTSILEAICASNRIPYINLFSIFLENDPDTLFFQSVNNHWNDKGQDIAARETAEALSQSSF